MLTPEERAEAIAGVPAGLDLLNELIDEKRKNPSDDFLSTLITAEEDGDKLSNWEMCAHISQLDSLSPSSSAVMRVDKKSSDGFFLFSSISSFSKSSPAGTPAIASALSSGVSIGLMPLTTP